METFNFIYCLLVKHLCNHIDRQSCFLPKKNKRFLVTLLCLSLSLFLCVSVSCCTLVNIGLIKTGWKTENTRGCHRLIRRNGMDIEQENGPTSPIAVRTQPADRRTPRHDAAKRTQHSRPVASKALLPIDLTAHRQLARNASMGILSRKTTTLSLKQGQ
jgi:hypothetical protein